jgi:hypothetical protein
VVCEVLLGEEVIREWVGPILVDPLPRQRAYVLFGKVTVGTPASVEVERMEARVRAEIEAIGGALPEEPRFRLPQVGYLMYQTKPQLALDYGDQDDLFVSTGVVPGLYQGVLDLPKALEVVRAVMRAGRLPQRCWLLFHDATLANEWLGLYPTTPPPPRGQPGDPPEPRLNRIQASLEDAKAPA